MWGIRKVWKWTGASNFTNAALYDLARANIDLDGDTLKLMLATSAYTNDSKDTVFVDEAGSDLTGAEISVSGYTGGFNGAGRKTVTITGEADNTNNEAHFAINDQTWTALGTGATIEFCALIKEVTNDAASKVIAVFDVTGTPTNGGDITLDFLALASRGNLRFAA